MDEWDRKSGWYDGGCLTIICELILDQITKKLWDIVSEQEGTSKDKMAALSLLMHCYSTRLELLVGGPQSDMNAKRHR